MKTLTPDEVGLFPVVPSSVEIGNEDVVRARRLWREASPPRFRFLLDGKVMEGEGKVRRPPVPARYFWDAEVGGYRNAITGRLVSQNEVRLAVDAVMVNGARARMREITERLVGRQITLGEWMREMMVEIRTAHTAAFAAARGGFEALMRNKADLKDLARIVRDEYRYLENFARQILSGEQALDGRAVSRAGMYGGSARATYQEARRVDMQERGFKEERRILTAFESCVDCIEFAFMGWQPIGTLPQISESVCLANCRCYFDFR